MTFGPIRESLQIPARAWLSSPVRVRCAMAAKAMTIKHGKIGSGPL